MVYGLIFSKDSTIYHSKTVSPTQIKYKQGIEIRDVSTARMNGNRKCEFFPGLNHWDLKVLPLHCELCLKVASQKYIVAQFNPIER